MKTSKILLVTFVLVPLAFAFACSDSNSFDSNGVGADTADAASPTEPAANTESTDANSPAKPAPDGKPAPDASDELGDEGGAVCHTRCEKAGCPDIEACKALCAKTTPSIPARCESTADALQTCADTKGKWKCSDGEATVGGECMNEAVALLDCVLAVALDGGLDAQVDGGLDAQVDARADAPL